MYGDAEFSPRPTDGKRFEIRKRRAAYYNGRYIEIKEFRFVTWDFGWWHGYVGYAPINTKDPKFLWADSPRIPAAMALDPDPPELWVNWQIRPFGSGAW